MLGKLPPRAGDPLFITDDGKPATYSTLKSMLERISARAGVANCHPHRFRHTFGSDMAPAGVSLPVLMQLMGHSEIDTTMLYVQISRQDVWQQYMQAVQNRILALPHLAENI